MTDDEFIHLIFIGGDHLEPCVRQTAATGIVKPMRPSYFTWMWRSIFSVRCLAAAILMIAAYALPSAAYAHSGHGAETRAASAGPALNGHVSYHSSYHARHHISQSAQAVIDVAGQSSGGNCDGFCCAASCAGCCGSLVMTPVALQPALTGQQRLSEIPDRRPDGVSAEALPRPPKSFV
jgi:hypothetical protein